MEQTVNTWSKGLQMDTNPMVQSNETLSNALNATFVTMNDNEVVLQNDMGNRRVDSAFLPTGYIPLGIKEHGGIIYVASYNPITNKGLIGSFPSPLRKFTTENLKVDLELEIPTEEISFKSFLGGVFDDTVYTFLKQDPIIITFDTPMKIGDKHVLYGNLNLFKPFLSNFFNAGDMQLPSYESGGEAGYKNCIFSPKNNLFTLSVGILNSQNLFVDITDLLVRWDDSGKIIEFDDKSKDYIFNSGYFIKNISKNTSENTEAIYDGIFTNNRNTALANTYSNKLTGPLCLKTEVNCFLLITYNIELLYVKSKYNDKDSVIFDNSSIISSDGKYIINTKGNRLEIEYGNSEEPLLLVEITSEGIKIGDCSSLIFDNTCDILVKYINNENESYSFEANNTNVINLSEDIKIIESITINFSSEEASIEEDVSSYVRYETEKYGDLHTYSELAKTFDAYDLIDVSENKILKYYYPEDSYIDIEYDEDTNLYTTEMKRIYVKEIDEKNPIFNYIIAPKLIDNDGRSFGNTETYESEANLDPDFTKNLLYINLTTKFIYNSPDLNPTENTPFSTNNNKLPTIYLKNLCQKGSINTEKINSGDIEILEWRFYNYLNGNKTQLLLTFYFYPKPETTYNNLKIVLKNSNINDLENNTYEYILLENLTSSSRILKTIDWGNNLKKRKMYYVELVCNVNGKEEVLKSNYWILTTNLFNNSFNFSDSNYIDNYCEPSLTEYREKRDDLFNIKCNGTLTINSYNDGNSDGLVSQEESGTPLSPVSNPEKKYVQVISKFEKYLNISKTVTLDEDLYPDYIFKNTNANANISINSNYEDESVENSNLYITRKERELKETTNYYKYTLTVTLIADNFKYEPCSITNPVLEISESDINNMTSKSALYVRSDTETRNETDTIRIVGTSTATTGINGDFRLNPILNSTYNSVYNPPNKCCFGYGFILDLTYNRGFNNYPYEFIIFNEIPGDWITGNDGEGFTRGMLSDVNLDDKVNKHALDNFSPFWIKVNGRWYPTICYIVNGKYSGYNEWTIKSDDIINPENNPFVPNGLYCVKKNEGRVFYKPSIKIDSDDTEINDEFKLDIELNENYIVLNYDTQSNIPQFSFVPQKINVSNGNFTFNWNNDCQFYKIFEKINSSTINNVLISETGVYIFDKDGNNFDDSHFYNKNGNNLGLSTTVNSVLFPELTISHNYSGSTLYFTYSGNPPAMSFLQAFTTNIAYSGNLRYAVAQFKTSDN